MSNNITEEFKKYLAGFFDGDGSITLEKQKNGYTLRIKFSQSNESWCDYIKDKYPILHKTNIERRDHNKRIEYELRATGKQIEKLIDDLLPYSILKYEQLLEAKKYIPLIGVNGKNFEKDNTYNTLKLLKKESKNKPYDRLCLEYISGLFDAEGCILLNTIKLTQKSDINILVKIGEYYKNNNKLSNYSLVFYKKEERIKFLEDIKKHCIYKQPQILNALEYLNGNTDKIETINKLKNQKKIDITNYKFKSQEEHKQ